MFKNLILKISSNILLRRKLEKFNFEAAIYLLLLIYLFTILSFIFGLNPIRTRRNFLINGPGRDRFDTTYSNVNNSRITKDKKSVFAPREAQFSDIKSKLFVIIFATLIFN